MADEQGAFLARASSSELVDVTLDKNYTSNNYNDEEDSILRTPCRNDVDRLRLFDRAIDDVGNGVFQIVLFSVAAMGFFVESAEMNVIGLLFPAFMEEWNLTEEDLSIIPSYTALGMLIGATVFGQLSDLKGRKAVFQLSLTWCVVFGYASSYARSLDEFAYLRLFLGIGYGGNLVCAQPLLLETVPSHSRGLFSALGGIGWFFGSSFSILLTYLYVEEKGWAWIVRVISLTGIPAIIGLLFYTPESIRFLLIQHRYEDAVRSFQRICNANSKPMPEYFTVENLKGENTGDEEEVQSGRSRLRKLLSPSVLVTLVPLSIIWFTQSFAHSIFPFIPLFLMENSDQPNIIFSAAFSGQVGDIIGTLAVIGIFYDMPRILELRCSLAVVGLAVIAIGMLSTHPQIEFPLIALAKTALQPMYHALYTYSPEVFPTQIRSAGFSVCQFSHRLAPILGPYAVTSLNEKSFELSACVFGGLFLLASLQTFVLRQETAGSLMVEDSYEAESEVEMQSSNGKQDGHEPQDNRTSYKKANLSLNEFDDMSVSSLMRQPSDTALGII